MQLHVPCMGVVMRAVMRQHNAQQAVVGQGTQCGAGLRVGHATGAVSIMGPVPG